MVRSEGSDHSGVDRVDLFRGDVPVSSYLGASGVDV